MQIAVFIHSSRDPLSCFSFPMAMCLCAESMHRNNSETSHITNPQSYCGEEGGEREKGGVREMHSQDPLFGLIGG